MSKMIEINEEIILYTNKLEKKAFNLIQDEIGQKLDQIVGLNIADSNPKCNTFVIS